MKVTDLKNKAGEAKIIPKLEWSIKNEHFVIINSSIKSADSAHLMLQNLIFKHPPIFNQ